MMFWKNSETARQNGFDKVELYYTLGDELSKRYGAPAILNVIELSKNSIHGRFSLADDSEDRAYAWSLMT